MPYKKYARKFKRNVIAPYTSKKKNRGYKNRMQLYKEVSAIKKMINAEKKNADFTDTSLIPLAQKQGSNTGGQCLNIMPTISQGSSEDQRNGDSLKVCSWAYKINIQTNEFFTLQDVRYKIFIVRQERNPVTTGSTGISQFLETNPFSGVEDFYSNRNYEHFKDWTVMGTATGILRPNTNNSSGQYRSNTHTIARKQQFHVRYDKGTNTVLNNPVYVILVASEGDRAATLTNIVNFQHTMKLYYYDN